MKGQNNLPWGGDLYTIYEDSDSDSDAGSESVTDSDVGPEILASGTGSESSDAGSESLGTENLWQDKDEELDFSDPDPDPNPDADTDVESYPLNTDLNLDLGENSRQGFLPPNDTVMGDEYGNLVPLRCMPGASIEEMIADFMDAPTMVYLRETVPVQTVGLQVPRAEPDTPYTTNLTEDDAAIAEMLGEFLKVSARAVEQPAHEAVPAPMIENTVGIDMPAAVPTAGVQGQATAFDVLDFEAFLSGILNDENSFSGAPSFRGSDFGDGPSV